LLAGHFYPLSHFGVNRVSRGISPAATADVISNMIFTMLFFVLSSAAN
jgi:hypothetical protein